MPHRGFDSPDRVTPRPRCRSLLGCRVVGTGSYVPDAVVTNDHLFQRFGFDSDWIVKRTGIYERRHALPHQATSDLAIEAIRRCLDRAKVHPRDIDLCLVGTFTPDYSFPSTACIIQDKLKLTCPAVDLQAACAGFMYALITGASYVLSGASDLALIVGADCNSRILNPDDIKTYPLFGDGAGAFLLARGGPNQGILSYSMGSDGAGGEQLIRYACGSRLPPTPELLAAHQHYMYMDGRAVFRWAVAILNDTIQDVLTACQLTPGDVDVYFPHQANIRIINAACDTLKIPRQKVYNNLDRYGNTSAGSIPLVVDEAVTEGRLKSGDLTVLSGFGAGLTWGTALMPLVIHRFAATRVFEGSRLRSEDSASAAKPYYVNMLAKLALEDGTIFTGRAFGAPGERFGEVVFNTSMTGYQEILTDPSYTGQIVTMTYPHIGNYGINAEDAESSVPKAEGFVVREFARHPSNQRSTQSLDDYLKQHGIPGIEGIDTRALVRRLRVRGAMTGVLSSIDLDNESLVCKAQTAPGIVGRDLVREVVPQQSAAWAHGGLHPLATDHCPLSTARFHVAALDYGMKWNIPRYLVQVGCRVTIVPGTASADDVLGLKPDGVFLSNGPGDPAVLGYAVDTIRGLIGQRPVFGICLGHQLLGQALGAKTFKLKFGHRGANHPVLNERTGAIEITTQNHGFALDLKSLPRDVEPTHINLNDRTNEGIRHTKLPVFSVQYHPESSAGPHDSTYLFDEFVKLMA